MEDLKCSTIKDAFTVVDSAEALSKVVDSLINLPTKPPSLYIDLEGVNLSRQGTISILQIHIASSNENFLIDIHTLGSAAFSTEGKQGHTLRSVLQSDLIPKVFFDVRNDSDALFSHYDISLAGVVDLQLMEYATRTFRRKFVNGLSKCIERDSNMTYTQRLEWQQVKERGVKLFAPEKGGTYEVFNHRPLSDDIGLYCVQDVQWLPLLYEVYSKKLNSNMSAKVALATLERVKDSQSPYYRGHGQHKALGPWWSGSWRTALMAVSTS